MIKANTQPNSGKRTGGGKRTAGPIKGPMADGDGGKLRARRPGSMAPRQRGDGGGKRVSKKRLAYKR